ncbi:UDP-N-acetylmuramoyl-L-alanine--D-glutamate ligase [bacterium]|nr:UDP-N-acetylmuramoyl-L-alanine--D-glutamate ligase [bacterium]
MLKRDKIKNTSITVMGAARSGMDVAILLKRKGASVFLSEMADIKTKADAVKVLQIHDIPFEFGGHTERIFKSEVIVLSPGIPSDHLLVKKAKSRHIEVLGELEVASWFCRGKMAAITGSNGKSTTTALLGEIAKQSGLPFIVAGNIGTSLSSQVDRSDEKGIAVVEVSNFQLETIRDFHPKVGVFLNLTPDHLDRHGTLPEYGRIKARIFENQTSRDFAIYYGEDAEVVSLVQSVHSQRLPFQTQDPGTDGAFILDERLSVRWQNRLVSFCSVYDVGIPGPHNVDNALAASMAAVCLDIPKAAIEKGLRSFRGLPHRLELVREINQVRWYNDSKATNVDSVKCALDSFENPIILIAGGRDKSSDFSVLKDRVQKKTRIVILIGEAAEKIERSWEGKSRFFKADSLSEAVENAHRLACPGDVVLLSPGCASFDMFENFEERGNQFKALVKVL